MIRQAPDVHADETSMRQQDRKSKAYIWTFITPELTLYRYATTRSGSVPIEVLGDSEGRLVVDAYTGYNRVTTTGQRVRAGCLAHARRKLFAQRDNPGVGEALDLFAQIYQVEREA
jgi:transposase